MYKFKVELYDKLMYGRTLFWLADQLGYSHITLSLIFNGHKYVKKALALAIVKTIDNSYEVIIYYDKIAYQEKLKKYHFLF